jgi:hypothetical protein
MHFALSTRQCSRHQVITNLRTCQLRGRALKPPQLATYPFRTLTAEFVRDRSFLRPISSLVTCSPQCAHFSSSLPQCTVPQCAHFVPQCVSSVAHQIRLNVKSSPMHAASMTALTSFTSTVSIASSGIAHVVSCKYVRQTRWRDFAQQTDSLTQ